MIKAITFDVGGVLVKNSENIIYKAFANLLDISVIKLKSEINSLLYLLGINQINLKEFYNKLKIKFPQSSKILNENYLFEIYKDYFSINNKILKLANQLRKNGYLTPILSNSIFIISEFNKKNGVYFGFDPVILSEEVGYFKPEQKMYLFFLKKTNMKPKEVIFIDDKIENIEATMKLGINGILYYKNCNLIEELKKLKIKI